MTGKEGMDSGSGAGMTGGDQPHIPFLRPFDSAHATARTYPVGPCLGMGMTGGERVGPSAAHASILLRRTLQRRMFHFQRAHACGGSSTSGCSISGSMSG